MKLKVNSPIDAEDLKSLRHIPLEALASFKDIHNRKMDDAWAKDLSESIARSGLDVPLIVWNGGSPDKTMKVGGESVPCTLLIAGFHRRRALTILLKENPKRFKELFPEGIPVVVKGGSLGEALATQVRENAARKNPEAAELLPFLQRLRDEQGWSGKQIAERIGRSPAWVSTIFSIEELGEEGVEEVVKGKTKVTDAIDAANKVRKGKATKEEAVAELKAKSKKKEDSGKERAEKRMSAKSMHAVWLAMPKMSIGNKLVLLEKGLEYLAGVREALPREFRSAMNEKSKAEKSS